jgi:hypothetical protein
MRLNVGDELVFVPRKGVKRSAVVRSPARKGWISVLLSGDPFSTSVSLKQLETKEGIPVPVAVRKSSEAKALRRDAKNLRIRNWQDMKLSELRTAVAEAQDGGRKTTRAKTKPVASDGMSVAKARRVINAAAGKRGRPSAEVLEARAVLGIEVPERNSKSAMPPKRPKRNGMKKVSRPRNATPKQSAPKVNRKTFSGDGTIPFRIGSNGYLITEELMKGGSRADMVKRLNKKIQIQPWSKEKEEDPELALDKRIILTAGILKTKHGWVDKRSGRGMSGTIQVKPPSKNSSNGHRKAVARKGTKRVSRA